MGAIDVAVFAFDMDEKLVLVNPAGERLLGQAGGRRCSGTTRSELRLAAYLTGDTPRLLDRPFGPESGRLELRRSTFRRDGKPHQLLVFADLSRALREEEQQAWQRIVRVLSHEINNSLTPIKSIAHSIKRMISRVPDLPRAAEIQDGLNLIETRSGSLGRFLRSYAQLARLPKPQERPIQIVPLAHRIAELENRLPVDGAARPTDVEVERRSRSARAAADQHRPQRRRRDARDRRQACGSTGSRSTAALQLTVEDEGPGLPDTSNLFVPFFTTKPTGLGHRPRAEPPDRRSARRHARAGEPRPTRRAAARSCGCRSVACSLTSGSRSMPVRQSVVDPAMLRRMAHALAISAVRDASSPPRRASCPAASTVRSARSRRSAATPLFIARGAAARASRTPTATPTSTT